MVDDWYYDCFDRHEVVELDPDTIATNAILIGRHEVPNPRLCKTVLDRPAEYRMSDDDLGCLWILVVFLVAAGVILSMVK